MLDLDKFNGHTPGKWLFFSDSQGCGATSEHMLVADIAHCSGFCDHRSVSEEEANARLIAAAPSLLAEVVRLRNLVVSLGGSYE